MTWQATSSTFNDEGQRDTAQWTFYYHDIFDI